jgi:uncharacterized protein YigA (DUF484 family)
MANTPSDLAKSVSELFDHQLEVRKTRKRLFSGEETALLSDAKKARKTSSELAAAAKKLDDEDDKAQNVEAIWKARYELLYKLVYVISILKFHVMS